NLVDVFDARIHDPYIGLASIEDLSRSPQHQPGEDRDLVRHQHRRERDAEDQTDVFGSITEENFERHTIHPSLRRRLRGSDATPLPGRVTERCAALQPWARSPIMCTL